MCDARCFLSKMASNPNCVCGRRRFLIANGIMLWLLWGLFAIVSSQPIEAESLSLGLSQTTGDVITIYERDLSPDTLATSVPVTSSHNGHRAPSPSRKGFLLRSSSSNVSGIGGNPLHALPIMASDLSEVLLKTQADLKSRHGDVSHPFYRVDTKHWSFLVNMAQTNLHYAAIQAVVTRFLKFASMNKSPQEVVNTRVGVLLNDSTPIADIAIMPCQPTRNSSDPPFSNFGNQSVSTSRPNEVFEVTPFGSSCVDQVVNETSALAPYVNQDLATKQINVTPRSLETEILAPLSQTVYHMGYRLWLDPVHGIPAEVKVWALKALCYTAGYLSVIEMLRIHPLPWDRSVSDASFVPRNRSSTVDTGDYVVGNLLARLMIQWIYNSPHPDPLTVMLRLNIVILQALLQPLEAMDAQANAFAMEGEVYGPSGNGTAGGNSTAPHEEGGGGGGKEVLAKWQISIRDKDEL